MRKIPIYIPLNHHSASLPSFGFEDQRGFGQSRPSPAASCDQQSQPGWEKHQLRKQLGGMCPKPPSMVTLGLSPSLGTSEEKPWFSTCPFYPVGFRHHFSYQSGPRIETIPQITGDPKLLGDGVRVAGLSQGLRQELICVREVPGMADRFIGKSQSAMAS